MGKASRTLVGVGVGMARSMMSRRQAADILGLHDDTNAREIKMAYRKLAIKWHPDKVPVPHQDIA